MQSWISKKPAILNGTIRRKDVQMAVIPVSEETRKDLQAAYNECDGEKEQFEFLASVDAALTGQRAGTISDTAINNWNGATPGRELYAFVQVQTPKNALPFANFLTADKTDPGNEPAPGG
jgi:hypothetical protein